MRYAMKICLSLLHVTTLAFLLRGTGLAQVSAGNAQIVSLPLSPREVTVLHLRKGYVSSVRLPEDVSAVVLGDPNLFRAEHSEAEPQLVFFKTISPRPAETNALITTRSGHEVALSLVSGGNNAGPVDYVLKYDAPHSFVIAGSHSGFLVAETRSITKETLPSPAQQKQSEKAGEQLLNKQRLDDPQFQGKQIKVAVGWISQLQEGMGVSFSVLNSSERTIELLPPQIQLASAAGKKHGAIKAEQVPIKDYQLTTRKLAPGSRADGVVIFDRPSFKESSERLLLEIAQAEAVDRPVLAPIAFVAPAKGVAK
jgi:hypothetical protein